MIAPKSSEALDVRLSALLDGQVAGDDRRDLEQQLLDDPDARAMHEQLQDGSQRGRDVFDDLLREPVPLDLVRAIRTAPQPRKAVRLPSEHNSIFPLKLTAMQIATSAALLFVVGGGLGYMLGKAPTFSSVQPRVAAAAQSDWMEDIVAHYRLFSRPNDRLVDMPADDPAAIIEWLLTNTGVNFRIPDLTANGLTFKGARLFVAGGMPVGHLVYTSADGEVIGILFRKNHPDDDDVSDLIRDNIALMSWKSPTATYIAVGPSSSATLGEIAAKAAGLI